MSTTENRPDGMTIVALSGGVDSAVAALLLKRSGHDVQALHMSNWDDDDGYCSAAEDLQDARRVCETLEIPLHHVSFATEYRDKVFADFLEAYRRGRTPNPDVLCNREIKFGVCLDYARRLGGARLATGHYARLRRGEAGLALRMAADANKDQTYFLHAVDAAALSRAVFPLGDLSKDDVRTVAAEAGLHVRNKKDSTGICFIGERPFRDFLSQFVAARPGPIMTTNGDCIGEHAGAIYYTPGQRRGLGIGGVTGASEKPWYVASRRIEDNTVVVVQGDDHPALWSGALIADDMHWIGERPAGAHGEHTSFEAHARIRHRQSPQSCAVTLLGDGRLRVDFAAPQWAVAPGQYVVLYRQDICLGGATIAGALAADGERMAS